MRICTRFFFLFLTMVLPWSSSLSMAKDGEVQVIQDCTIHLDDGKTIQNGAVIIRDGRITAVGKDLKIPEGARIISSGPGHLTPGLIDASATAGVTNLSSWAEHGSEVIPHLRNLDAVDLDAKAFGRLAAEGVTTVYLTPDPSSVIGTRGAVVKTGGPEAKRILHETLDVKINMGPEGWRRGAYNRAPSSGRRRRGSRTESPVGITTRRPTTRMGMAWVVRKALLDATRYEEKREQGKVDEDPAMEVLSQVLKGKIPVRIQAREDIDIWSAIRIAKEYGLTFIVEEGTEAYRCIPELKANKVPVIFGPVYQRYAGSRVNSGEALRICLNTAGQLVQAGIPMALTAGGLTGEDALPYQAGYAIRHGLSYEDALKATTRVPAEMLFIQHRVGALKPGLDADLVLWTDRPFSITAKPALVMITGEVVYQESK